MTIFFQKIKKTFFDKGSYFLSDVLFICLIVGTIYFFVDFSFGKYLFSGDFRFHIFRESIGDQFLSLISNKFSNNNFIFTPFYSLYYLLHFFSYHSILAYIFFGIPVLIFFSVRYVLIHITHFKYDDLSKYFMLSSLAFYVATSPALFERFGHFTILHSVIAFPLFIYFLYEYFKKEKTVLTWHPFIIAILVFLGAMTPQSIVVYFVSGAFILIASFIFSSQHQGNFFSKYARKILFVSFLAFVSLSHILYPILMGYGQAKSRLESPTTAGILLSLSRESSVFSALSGTNFYSQEIIFPFQIGAGFLIFFISILLFVVLSVKHKRQKEQWTLFFLLIGLVVISGYKVFPQAFNFLSATYLSHFLWIVKDPNMYYQFFAVILVIFAARMLFNLGHRIKPKHLFIFGSIIITLNVFMVIFSDHDRYRAFYSFVSIPQDYFDLSTSLKNDNGRNTWLPDGIYVLKNFASSITFFPTPALWLTQNKELTNSTEEYENLLEILQTEIYEKGCHNVSLIDWIIANQNLNVIIDHNSINNKTLNVKDVELKLDKTETCLKRLPNVYLYKSFGNIDVYKTRTQIRSDLYMYSGTLDSLNDFLKNNPVNVVYSSSHQESNKKIEGSFVTLNESYDENWRNIDGSKPAYKTNFSSMAFEGNEKMFYYRGEAGFQRFVFWQKVVLIVFLLLSIWFIIKEKKDVHV